MTPIELNNEISFPIGPFKIDSNVTAAKRGDWITQMALAPANLRAAVAGLSEQQIGTQYRPDGWTLRQVVHHLADAHLNGFMRFKLTLTEDNPTIKTYEESLWAETVDGRDAPIELSLKLIEALHERWVMLLKSLPGPAFSRTLSHPQMGIMNIDAAIQLYAWHGLHHTAHIAGLREREGWA